MPNVFDDLDVPTAEDLNAPIESDEPEEETKPAKPASQRKAATAKKPKVRMGRRPLGPKTMAEVLQVRMTNEMRAAVVKMGGSTWARGILEASLKRAVKRGVKLPKAFLKQIEK